MSLSRTMLLLQLLSEPVTGTKPSAIQGITRLQKLLFLAEREAGIAVDEGEDFNFSAYKFGPVSKDLYDDIEKLENLGFIETEGVAEPTAVELDEYGLSFEGLMGDETEVAKASLEERRYSITQRGQDWLKKNAASISKEALDGIRKVKGKYGKLSLSDLLYYVYSKYPAMTTESEIREKVLGR